jgi:uncharacterized protein YfdQ (DUF2303 family)
MTDIDNVQAVIDTAKQASTAQELQVGKIYTVALGAGCSKTIDLTGDEWKATPSRKTGSTTVRDVPSFLAYYGKHADDSTEVYADVDRHTVTAVLDAHAADADGARWGSHRVALALRTTQSWRDWTGHSGKLMSQDEFAEFLEDHVSELVAPAAAEMLEIAQSLQAATKVEFKSASRLADGQRQFEFVETVQAKAGTKGQLTIPESFKIGVKVFEGAEVGDTVTALLRYRINGDKLTIGYKLQQPQDVLTIAFQDVVTAVGEGINGGTVLNGTPA